MILKRTVLLSCGPAPVRRIGLLDTRVFKPESRPRWIDSRATEEYTRVDIVLLFEHRLRKSYFFFSGEDDIYLFLFFKDRLAGLRITNN